MSGGRADEMSGMFSYACESVSRDLDNEIKDKVSAISER